MKRIGFILSACTLFFLLSFSGSKNKVNVYGPYQETADSLKNKAFVILEEHCNECHLKKKPAYVFTFENMEAFAPLINIQVFIKKKMPKGKKYPMTAEERNLLERWVKNVMD